MANGYEVSIANPGSGTVATTAVDGTTIFSANATTGLNIASLLLLGGSAGTAGQVLTSQGAAANPVWAAAGGGGGGYATGVRQIVSSFTPGVSSTTTVLPQSSSVPTNTQGAQFASATITPQSATSSILVLASIQASTGNINTVGAALFRDSTTNAFSAAAMACLTATTSLFVFLSGVVSSGSTAASTFKLRAGPAGAGTLTVNGYSGTNQIFGTASNTGIILIEYGA